MRDWTSPPIHRAPLWAIPLVYVAASALAAIALPRLEHAFLPGLAAGISVESARQCFAAIASGMMAFTGVVFAVAFLVVQFGSAAYSPRLTVLFVGQPQIYHTLGLFFATFTYSLAALSWTDRGGAGHAPLISSLIVAVLMFFSMLAFALLVRSVSELQIHNVLQTIGRRGRAEIAAMPPLDPGEGTLKPVGKDLWSPRSAPIQQLVYDRHPQVVAELALKALCQIAQSADAIIQIDCAVGDTLRYGSPIASIYGAPAPEAALRRCVRLAPLGTFEQDPRFPIRLLVDVAIRALSPAINDPTTAVQSLDQIEDLLRLLAHRQLDTGVVRDPYGIIRVVFPARAWDDFLQLAFDEIRHYGSGSIQVQRRLRAALVGLRAAAPEGERRAAVSNYLRHLDQGIRRSAFDAQDRAAGRIEDPQGLGSPRRPKPTVVAG
jgi:uncharacterized membrane protein